MVRAPSLGLARIMTALPARSSPPDEPNLQEQAKGDHREGDCQDQRDVHSVISACSRPPEALRLSPLTTGGTGTGFSKPAGADGSSRSTSAGDGSFAQAAQIIVIDSARARKLAFEIFDVASTSVPISPSRILHDQPSRNRHDAHLYESGAGALRF